jgi:hypothetical protein
LSGTLTMVFGVPNAGEINEFSVGAHSSLASAQREASA